MAFDKASGAIPDSAHTATAALGGGIGPEIGTLVSIGRYLSQVVRDMHNVSKRELAVSSEYRCLAEAIYFEARGEPLMGQLAVAHVVMNRVRDRRYPDTICGVVFQNEHRPNRCQFSFACDGQSAEPTDLRAWSRSLKVALQTLAGASEDMTDASTHYHANYVAPYWASMLEPTIQLGQHLFYREDLPGARVASYDAP
ncbi:MAG: cell wall hydrolase [Sphingomonadales bacterium]